MKECSKFALILTNVYSIFGQDCLRIQTFSNNDVAGGSICMKFLRNFDFRAYLPIKVKYDFGNAFFWPKFKFFRICKMCTLQNRHFGDWSRVSLAEIEIKTSQTKFCRCLGYWFLFFDSHFP